MFRRLMAGSVGGLVTGMAANYNVAACSSSGSKDVEVVLVGTGSSVGVPQMRCLLSETDCKVCTGAGKGDKNWRGNPCIMLRVPNADRTDKENIIVDMGKTFREASMRLFKDIGAQYIDAVLLTHFHADATLGLDDLRDYQRVVVKADVDKKIPARLACTPVYCDKTTFSHLQNVFPYLMAGAGNSEPKKKEDVRFVSNVSWTQYNSFFDRFKLKGLDVATFPVVHGNACTSVGYDFTSPEARFVYISDVSEIPKKSDEHILAGAPIDVLVIDALFLKRRHNTHFSLPEALEAVKRYGPKKAYLVGMSHELDYYTTNEELRKLKATDGIDVEMGYDGLKFTLPLLNAEKSSL
eukprot:TRINITY_DN31325_c0_g1_i1.p1 TRINITY_DN31325_c0_g1~~TRINITY_DN31325_c0_g1_i1.p1  ORF type:complete len:370 (+),score=76.96 TRINITY_DN31325_c0_g1_i1:55-1110(+)